MVKPKLLMLTTGLSHGGAETQLVKLATTLKKRGWYIKVISMLPPQAFVDELAGFSIPVMTLNMQRGKATVTSVPRLLSLLKQTRPAIVHSHMIHANLLVRVARLVGSMPVVVNTVHSVNEGSSARYIAYRYTARLADVTTTICHAAAEEHLRLKATPARRLKVIPNGIDLTEFASNDFERNRLRQELGVSTSFVWLAVGRLEVPKDYANLLNAFFKVQQQVPELVLLVVGEGSLRADLESLANDLGIDAKVRFLGLRKDVPTLMNAADAYVMSSAWEGLPIVLLEAAATGLPIVATDVGGNGEIVVDGRSGYSAPPRDSEKLADAMGRLMNLSEAERRQMGQAGRAHVQAHFDIERVVDQWETLYNDLLKWKHKKTEGQKNA